MTSNAALVASVWAFGKHEAEFRRLRNDEKRAGHRAQAVEFEKSAIFIASLLDSLTYETTPERWCSGCFSRSAHRKVRTAAVDVPTYLCDSCGSPTTPCLLPRCPNFANRGFKKHALRRYCAEHRHEIPSFGKLDARLKDIDEYARWLEFEKPNAAQVTKLITATVAAGTIALPMAFVAAPAIGGAVGALTGLSGAAATSHGLALLGGGAIAAGGLGMAGGTAVVTALGSALGGALGASVTSAYTRSDKSFRIERLRDGSGTPILLANGFLTEGGSGWGGWRRLVDERFPEAPVYRVYWGSAELKDLGALLALGPSKQAAVNAAKVVARKSSRLAKIPGLSHVLFAADIATNPWMLAKTRAGMTGVALAGIIARTETEKFILIGHSLGARVMATAASALGTIADTKKIEEVHLLGAAIGVGSDWQGLSDSVSGKIWNYRSENDAVLKYVYRTAELGKRAVGLQGFRSSQPNIADRDVSRRVLSHSDYFVRVSLEK